MISINIRCSQNCANLEKMLFTLGKLRNYVSRTAAQRFSVDCGTIYTTNVSERGTSKEKQQILHYSKSTAMPHKVFRMTDYDIVGFDLDGTLLRYNLNNMVRLEHKLLQEFLVKEKNYPEELLNQKFESAFIQKGLIIDSSRGNILKLNENGTIIKATHGTRFMDVSEICQIYGELRKWDVAQEYIQDPLSAWNGPIANKLRALLDYFDIGASLVFAQAVDIVDNTSGSTYTLGKNDYMIWPDILAGLIQIYSREHFASGISQYFEALKAKPEKYLLKTGDKVVELLKELRASGKALYLLTGSNIDFANFSATYALGSDWYDLFDYIIGFAKKPGFFFAQRPFLKIDHVNEVAGSEISLNEYLTPNAYSQGNWQQLKQSMCKYILHKDPEQVRSLYVGDNLIQDIYAPNTAASIDTLALSEELLENDNTYDYKLIVTSPLWGSYFKCEGTPTLWSKIIEKYSQLCISHIDLMVQVNDKGKVDCENKEGFFPKQPDSSLVR